MIALVVLGILLVVAVLAPLVGVDSRWEGAAARPDRSTGRTATAGHRRLR